jgi:hypothetical protein
MTWISALTLGLTWSLPRIRWPGTQTRIMSRRFSRIVHGVDNLVENWVPRFERRLSVCELENANQ